MIGGRKVITLCGSTRFKAAWLEWAARLTLEGNVVLTLGWFDPVRRVEPSSEQKALLDEIHLRKIDLADEVFVLDVGHYIGDSTEKEIAYAWQAGKRVRFLSQEHPGWSEEDCELVPGARAVAAQGGVFGGISGEPARFIEEASKLWDRFAGAPDVRGRAHAMIDLLELQARLLEAPGFSEDLQSILAVSEEPSRLTGILRRWEAAARRLIQELEGGALSDKG